VPHMLALSVNSPFWQGEITDMQSSRVLIFSRSIHRAGLPDPLVSWDEYADYVDFAERSGAIQKLGEIWWDVRPAPQIGTVELRAPDVQTDAPRTAALVALVQCLVAGADDRAPEDPLLVSENKWRAVRHGMDATFYDFAGRRSVQARALARGLVEELRPIAQELFCEAELEGVLEIVERGTGAGLQRAAFGKSGSLEGLVDRLVEATVPA